jgi:hypothetical protein
MVFFNLRDLKNENNDKSETKIRDNQFVLKGGLMTQNTVYSFSSKLKPNFMGPLVLGKYDPAIKTGQIFFKFIYFSMGFLGIAFLYFDTPKIVLIFFSLFPHVAHYENYQQIYL